MKTPYTPYTVHIVENERSLCGVPEGPPSRAWPDGHYQVSAKTEGVTRAQLLPLVTCADCRALALPKKGAP